MYKYILLILISSACIAADHGCAYKERYTEVKYTDFHKKAISLGWRPDLEKIEEQRGGINPDGLAIGFLKSGIEEVAYCAGSGEGNCVFLLKKGNQKLKVITYDDPSLVKYIEVCEA